VRVRGRNGVRIASFVDIAISRDYDEFRLPWERLRMRCLTMHDGISHWRRCVALRPLVVAVGLLVMPLSSSACDAPVGRLVSSESVVVVRAAGTSAWVAVRPPYALCEGDQVAVHAPGRAAVVLDNDILVRLDGQTTLQLTRMAPDVDAELALHEGILHVITRFRKRFGVTTPYVNALVDGTEFTISARDGRGQVVVAEGLVRARNALGENRLQAGEAAEAAAGAAPAGIAVRPLDAVRWAIHYPQVAWLDEVSQATLPQEVAAAIGRAQQAMVSARNAEALAMLEALPAGSVTSQVEALRISVLLALGRVDEARERLDRNSGTPDAALTALDAVIRVARNDADGALASARRAVELDADSGGARLALSYALQARRDVGEALEAARTATRLAPGNPFAWARQAELELSLAQLDNGRMSAARALAFDGALPRARALVGFAQLLGGEPDAARGSFDAAIVADSAEPLARFGSGLAHVRAGDLTEARRDIELAVLLDPGNAELRSYLGRVYVEEDRSPLGGEQFALARRLDPASPTPWYFDAFRKLRDNDPLGAIEDGSKAIELNDNRAVFRSPALLDGDRAARSASLGAAYREVGFAQPMRAAAMRALDDDPMSAAGHRLLAESYAETPRFETARVSELLQAQLRKPIGQWPIPPQFLSPNLPIVSGPRGLAPEEASALFERKPYHFAASLLGGSQQTWGDSLVASRSFERGQVSVGHFDYRRQGLHEDGDIELTGTRLDAQLAPAPGTMIYGELGAADRSGGDVIPRLLQGVGAAWDERRQDVQSQNGRLSLRHAPSLDSEVIVTAGAKEVDERTLDKLSRTLLPGINFDLGLGVRTQISASDVGILYAVKGTRYDLAGGAGSYHEARRQQSELSLGGPGIPLGPSNRETVDHNAGFAYANLRPLDWATVHLGAAYARLRADGAVSAERVSGKGGVTFRPTPATALRVAVFQGVKGPKYLDQTVEPTQFAGFNQVFDDLDGTRWRRTAIGLDHRFGNGVATGLEWSRRTLEVPSIGCGLAAACRADWRERLHGAHVVVPFGKDVALSLAWRYEGLRLADQPVDFFNLPYRTKTEIVPLGMWLKLAARLSTRVEAVRVRQQATIVDAPEPATRTESAWLANARLSYVQPDRRFGFMLAAYNIFDRRIAIQDTDLSGNPRVPLFYPSRTVLLQATILF
jgi:tetratricopeptide (TPR) repeat protein